MNECIDTALSKLDKLASSGEVVDIHKLLSSMTFEVIGSTAFGVKFPVQTEENIPLLVAAHTITRNSPIFSPITVLSRLFPAFEKEIEAWFRKHPTESIRQYLEALKVTDATTESVLKDRTGKEEIREDFISLLLHARDGQTDRKLSPSEVRDQCLGFLLGGYETTANALAFTIYELAQHEDVARKLREEIQREFGDGYPQNMDDLKKLPYTSVVLNESMRLFPPVALISRSATKPVNIGGYDFPVGQDFHVPIYAIHHNAKYWPNPEKFDPERWFSNSPYLKSAFFPFGNGPRNCVGMRFALMEATLVLARICKQFTFKLSNPEKQIPLKLDPKVTVNPKDGILVTVHKVK
jgi:cytochrome P450